MRTDSHLITFINSETLMDDHLKLVNRLIEIVIANLSTVEAWGFYLISDEFTKEQELRNRLGLIWICSLFDSLEAEARFLPEIAREGREKGFDDIEYNAGQLIKFCALIGEVLDQYSKAEQLFLINLRNQWVHSYFANRHREQVSVKFCEAGKIRQERMTWDDYHSVIRPFFENGKSLDETLTPMIARALNMKLRYWHAIGVFQKTKMEIYLDLKAKKRITIRV